MDTYDGASPAPVVEVLPALASELLFKEPALTTAAARRNPLSLTVALSAGGQAWGDLFWDDGDGIDTFETGNYSYIVFVAGEVRGGTGA